MALWDSGDGGELFGAESKAQVYGNVHTFLQRNEQSTRDLGMSI